MNLKVTIALIILAVASIVVYLVNPFSNEVSKEPPKPWFYQVSVDDMTSIRIDHEGISESFIKTPSNTWAFDWDVLIPPAHNRWGGIAFILGGPQTKRDLTETTTLIENPAQYGLDNPHTVVTIGLTLGRTLEFRLGDKTTDGMHHYGQIVGFPQLFLIADTWGNVLARLTTDPPYPEWYIDRPSDSISEINVFPKSEDATKDEAQLNFKRQTDGTWEVTDYLVSTESRPVNKDKWQKLLPIIKGPSGVKVAIHKVEDRDYSQWGLGDNSAAVEIRFRNKTEQGTTYTDGSLLLIGNIDPSGEYYYGKSSEENASQPVLLFPKEWVETALGLYDDIPYVE
ncbi:DUF4340 domain-containing protein [Chloroflexi bacterium]|nr:DUF4340 domain-containing protein [Chloroflexota bacterium]